MIGKNETLGFTVKCDVCIYVKCSLHFLDPLMEPYPHQFATALFSFLYHLASYDAGGEALVSCGMMEALLKVQDLNTYLFFFSNHRQLICSGF